MKKFFLAALTTATFFSTPVFAMTCAEYRIQHLDAMHQKYNTLVHNNQSSEKQALKAAIEAETNALAPFKAEHERIAEMYKQYGIYDQQQDEKGKHALKPKIGAATKELEAKCRASLDGDGAMTYALVRKSHGNAYQYYSFSSDDLRNTVITVLFNQGKGSVPELQALDNASLVAMMP